MELDVLVGAFADLNKKVDKLTGMLSEMRPVFKPVSGSIQTAGTGTYLIRTNQIVPAGRIWSIYSLGAYTGVDAHTPQASALIDWYASAPVDVGSFPHHPSDVLINAQALPSTYYFSRDVAFALPGEEIYAIGYSMPANSGIIVVANVADYHLDAKAAFST